MEWVEIPGHTRTLQFLGLIPGCTQTQTGTLVAITSAPPGFFGELL